MGHLVDRLTPFLGCLIDCLILSIRGQGSVQFKTAVNTPSDNTTTQDGWVSKQASKYLLVSITILFCIPHYGSVIFPMNFIPDSLLT